MSEKENKIVICPNCGKQMEDKSYSKLEPFYHWEDECTYYAKNYYEKFVCKDCKISLIDDEWKIPTNLEATEKQINACKFVSNMLRVESPPPVKHAMWKFLKDNLNKAIELKNYQYNMQGYDDDEYFHFPPILEEDCY